MSIAGCGWWVTGSQELVSIAGSWEMVAGCGWCVAAWVQGRVKRAEQAGLAGFVMVMG